MKKLSINKGQAWVNYLGPEDHLHIQVVQYLQLQYPEVFFVHTPNEGKRSKWERFKFKALGGTAGVPDLLIFHSSKECFFGLAIELKIKPNKPTESQWKCLAALEAAGWKTFVIYEFDDAKEVIDNYLRG